MSDAARATNPLTAFLAALCQSDSTPASSPSPTRCTLQKALLNQIRFQYISMVSRSSPMAAARLSRPTGPQRTYRLPPATICGPYNRNLRIDIQHIQRLSSDICRDGAICFTSAKSRTRRSRRLAIRGVRAHDEQLPARRHHSSQAP